MDWKAKQHLTTRLGQILIDKKLISESQLDAAMREQGRSGRRLGEILADMKLITQAQVQGAIRRQHIVRLAASIATAVLGPAHAYAASVTAPAAPVAEARPFGDDASAAWSGVALDRVVAGRPSDVASDVAPDVASVAAAVALDGSVQAAGLRMQALDDTNALAVFQHAVATAQTMQQGAHGTLPAGVRVAGGVDGPAMARATTTLALNVNVTQVTTGPGTAYATIGSQGMAPLGAQVGIGGISGIGPRDAGAGGQASVDMGRIGGKLH